MRRAVDRNATPNRFLLAGSASPTVAPTQRKLLTGTRPPIAGRTRVGLADYAREIVVSGFPGFRHLTGRALRAQLDGYLSRAVQRDFLEQGTACEDPRCCVAG